MRAWIAQRLISLGAWLHPPKDPRAGLRTLKTLSQDGVRIEILTPVDQGGHLDSIARISSSWEGESIEVGWVSREHSFAVAQLLTRAARYMDLAHRSCEPIEAED
jgi:hypothetical protein